MYLLRWKTTPAASDYPPLSWHSISELSQCFVLVQDYLDSTLRQRQTSKLRSLDFDVVDAEDAEVYNGVLEHADGYTVAKSVSGRT